MLKEKRRSIAKLEEKNERLQLEIKEKQKKLLVNFEK